MISLRSPSGLPCLARVGDDAEELRVGAAVRARRARTVGVDEVVVDAVLVCLVRRSPHRVRDVVVEAGEEAEAVLAGERPAPAGRGAGDRDAARLAAERLALVDRDLEAALGELVRGCQPGHPPAEDRHGPAVRRRPARLRERRCGIYARRGSGHACVAKESATRHHSFSHRGTPLRKPLKKTIVRYASCI